MASVLAFTALNLRVTLPLWIAELGAKAESIFVNSQTRCGSESEGEFTR